MRRFALSLASLAALTLAACGGTEAVDEDGDTFAAGVDCDDSNAAVFPGAPELCDGIDNDCNTLEDDNPVDAETVYLDADGDGFGSDSFVTQCQAPEGYAANTDDCNDDNEAVNPGADEVCDGLDNNCDGELGADETDGDGDGWPACRGDCDDANAAVNPVAAEVCDDLDNDCNNLVDDNPTDGTTYYFDSDGDGFGGRLTQRACAQPDEFVANGDDCDDNTATAYPGATEICDGADSDCDGVVPVDELDTDGDGWTTCRGDCDDTDSTAFLGGTEVCDGADNDCNGKVDDDATDGSTWYFDFDGDGYGGRLDRTACAQPDGYVATSDDCDDAFSGTYPGADEYCDGRDNDCDTTTDEDDALDAITWYLDDDEDGFGDPDVSDVECYAPSGYVDNDEDCDDDLDTVNPDGVEVCNGLDDDCDEVVDFGISVPNDYTTIQDAIDDASSGDIVCIAKGTYTENIDLKGEDITLEGSAADEVFIEGDATDTPVVTIDSSEDEDTILRNLTITGGSAMRGAGLYIQGANPTLDGVVISENKCNVSTSSCQGAGVYVNNTSGTMHWTDVEIVDNECTSSQQCYGTGLYVVNGDIAMDGVTFAGNISRPYDNVSTCSWSYVYGGSIHATSSAELDIQNSVFEDEVLEHGALCSGQYMEVYGGGIYATSNARITLDDTEFNGFQFNADKGYTGTEYLRIRGGALYGTSSSQWTLDDVDFTGFENNHARSSAEYLELWGGALYATSSSRFDLDNVVFEDHTLDDLQQVNGGLVYQDFHNQTMQVNDVDFLDNTIEVTSGSTFNGGLWYNYYSYVNMQDVLFEGNAVDAVNGSLYGGLYRNWYYRTDMRDITFRENTVDARDYVYGGLEDYTYTQGRSRYNLTYEDNVITTDNWDIYGGLRRVDYRWSGSTNYYYNEDFRGNNIDAGRSVYGGLEYSRDWYVHHYNTILAGNAVDAGSQIYGGLVHQANAYYGYWYHTTAVDNACSASSTTYGCVYYYQPRSSYYYVYMYNNSWQDNSAGTNYYGSVWYSNTWAVYWYGQNNQFNGNDGGWTSTGFRGKVYNQYWSWGTTPSTSTSCGYNCRNTTGRATFASVTGSDPTAWDLEPASGSNLVDAGRSVFGNDPDGSTPDIGAYGGPYADDW